MQVKDLPFLILAAGSSTRFIEEHRRTHKSLLKVDSEHTIFEIILQSLILNGVSQVSVILGFKAQEFTKFLREKKRSILPVDIIYANDEYVKGPLFTLFSFLPYLSEKISNVVIIPSDTIFNPSILDQVLSTNVADSKNSCQLFTLNLSEEQISQFNKQIPFSPQFIDTTSKFYPLITYQTNPNLKACIVPILLLTRTFFNYVKEPENRISDKILPTLSTFYERTGQCKVNRVAYDEFIPPFIDIDTSLIYNSLHSVKKELFQAYKYK